MNSLFSRLWLSITFTIILLVSVIWMWFNHSQIHSQNLVQQSLHKELAEHMAHINPLLSQGITADHAIKEAFHDFMLLGPSFEIYTLDNEGNIVAFAAKDEVVTQRQIPLTPIKQFINGSKLPIFNTDPRGHGNKVFSASKLVNSNGIKTGYLYVIIGGEQFDAWQSLTQASQSTTQVIIIFIFLIVAVSIIFALLILFFTAPTKKLATALSKINVDELGNELKLQKPLSSSTEISNLTDDINALLYKLNHQHKQITHSHQARHEFLLHLSHDLKTPLTTLLGYLETWLISDESNKQQKWIELASHSGEKLKDLLTQLLELAAIDNGQIQPKVSQFDIAELFEELSSVYAQQAKAKEIAISFISLEGMHIATDIQILRRILCNLIDNALRYTPNQGVINVTATDENNQTLIKVNDSGSGFSAENFETLIKKNQTHYSGNSLPQIGVGLSIVKKLSYLLDIKIHVKSNASKGTCFELNVTNTALH